MRTRLAAVLVLLLVLAAGCGAGSPPDPATSEQQIRQTAIDFNVLAAQGDGDGACDLLTPEKRDGWMDSRFMKMLGETLPPEVHDCASWWGWMGPRLPAAGRAMFLNTQVSAVRLDGERATATYATGGTIALRWSDGRWRLD